MFTASVDDEKVNFGISEQYIETVDNRVLPLKVKVDCSCDPFFRCNTSEVLAVNTCELVGQGSSHMCALQTNCLISVNIVFV